ncbi:Molybdopterin synthase catalytic subunit 1 [bacterium HR37]|nr:Molybdopterin synthase catalytic subunit 1 [bacterium HR37]
MKLASTDERLKKQDFFRITQRKVGIESVLKRVIEPESGATVVFIGSVRKHSREREVLYLEYEVYKKMALKEFKKIAQTTRKKWDVNQIAIVHRAGKVEPGEVSVIIAVSSPHRTEAYEASRFIIEMLKKSVPIWKKEVWEGGQEWIHGS